MIVVAVSHLSYIFMASNLAALSILQTYCDVSHYNIISSHIEMFFNIVWYDQSFNQSTHLRSANYKYMKGWKFTFYSYFTFEISNVFKVGEVGQNDVGENWLSKYYQI